MGGFPLTEEAVRILASQGNRHLARALIAETAEGRESLVRCGYQAKAVSRAVLAPVIDKREPERSLITAVRLDSEAGALKLDSTARESVEEALAAAWELVGGEGERPAEHVRLDAVEVSGREVTGHSLYLPVALAAAAHWGGVKPVANVLATGHPGVPLGHLAEKLRLRQEALAPPLPLALHEDALFVASADAVEGEGVVAVQDLEATVERVFSLPPWHSSAAVVHVHAHSGVAVDIAPHGGREGVKVIVSVRRTPSL